MNRLIKFLSLIALLIGSASIAMDVNQNDQHPRAAELCRAVRNGNLKSIQALLEAGVPIDIRNDADWNPMRIAAQYGQIGACKMLINAKAQVDTPSLWHKNTPLMRAAAGGHTEICQLLLDAKAQIDAKDNGGWTPKVFALYNDQVDVYQLFLDYDIKPIKEKRAAAIALLGIKKFNRASCMRMNTKDEIQLIARQIFDPTEITNLFAQIDAIKNNETREFLRTYAQKQFGITSETNQGGLNE